MNNCPFDLLYAVDCNKFTACSSCEKHNSCSEIQKKYCIVDAYEEINFLIAHAFIFDIFKAGWKHHYSLKEFAKNMGYAKKKSIGGVSEVWVISYKNIFEMMQLPIYMSTPIYKKQKGEINGKKNSK